MLTSFFAPEGAPVLATDASLTSSTKTHPIQQYLRDLTKQLPRVDDTGFAYKAKEGTRGHQSKASREYFNNPQRLQRELPANPHFVAHPRVRAKSHVSAGKFWTDQDMKKARDEFYIPAETKVIVICPELYDRDLLRKSDAHRTTKGGLMSPCPKCKTNYYVRIHKWTSRKPSTQKVVNQKLTQDIIIGAIYGCFNRSTGCCKATSQSTITSEEKDGEQEGQKKGGEPSTFTAYTGEVWNQFPDSIRRRYLDYVSDIDDRNTQLMLSPGFCDRLLFYKGSFEEFTLEMKEAQSFLGQAATTAYRNFCQEENSKLPPKPKHMAASQYKAYKQQKWPAFKDEKLHEYFNSPVANTVIKMFETIYDRVEPYLLRDLLTRHGGRFL